MIHRNLLCIWAATAFSFQALTGCGSPQDQGSNLDLVNGRLTEAEEYAAVRPLLLNGGLCTSSALSHRMVITAKHCIIDKKAGAFVAPLSIRDGHTGQKAVAVIPFEKEHVSSNPAFDVALLLFPDHSFSTYVDVSQKLPQAGESVTMVGYGKTSNFGKCHSLKDCSGAGKKRVGTNTIKELQDTRIMIQGTATHQDRDLPLGHNASVAEGDSGGPLFNQNGELIGVLSSGLFGLSFYAAVGSEPILDLIHLALDEDSRAAHK